MATSKSKPRRAIIAAVTAPPTSPIPPAATAVKLADLEAEEQVKVFAPKGFTFTREDHSELHVRAGHQNMPVSLANHWFVKAMGVKLEA